MEYKVVTVPYFLDTMRQYELDILLESLQLSVKDSWERTRYICYLFAQCNSKKKLNLSDIIQFEWDNNAKKEAKTVAKEDVERLKEKMNNVLKTRQ